MSPEEHTTPEALDTLAENAANEQVELLIEVLENEFVARKQLEQTVKEQKRRIRRLEAQSGLLPEGDVLNDPHWDHYDQKVLQTLADRQPGKIQVRTLKNLYRKRTEIRRDETLKDRVKKLTEHGPFEHDTGSTWEYTGIEA